MAKPRPFWDHCGTKAARQMAGRALDGLRLKNGGPYNNVEVRHIVADLLGLPHPTGLMRLDKRQCHELVLRLIVLGLT